MSAKVKPLVINSDDFGYGARVNRAIVRAFEGRLCSSATIMANMLGFEEAVQLAHEHHLVDSVGVHVVLSEGTPLTDPIKGCSRLCDENGRFQHLLGPCYRHLTQEERNAVKIEIGRQIDKCRAHGLPLTHLDSHHHVHHSWGDLAHVFIEAAEEKGIPFIRPRRLRPGVLWYRRIPTVLYNAKLRHRRRAGLDYFIDVRTYLQMQDVSPSWQVSHAMEMMVHPTLGKDGSLMDAVDDEPLSSWVSQIEHYQSAVSYARLADE